MKKQHPLYLNNKFYNDKKESVVIKLKDVIFHYIVNIFSTSHLYKSKKNNNHIPLRLCNDYFFFKDKKKLSEDITIIPLGHATVIIIYKDKVILFDPLFKSSSFF